MKFHLQKSAFVAIGPTLAVIIFVTLPPSAQGNNPPVSLDSKHRASSWRRGKKGRPFPLDFLRPVR